MQHVAPRLPNETQNGNAIAHKVEDLQDVIQTGRATIFEQGRVALIETLMQKVTASRIRKPVSADHGIGCLTSNGGTGSIPMYAVDVRILVGVPENSVDCQRQPCLDFLPRFCCILMTSDGAC
jgi:hypothetical protein